MPCTVLGYSREHGACSQAAQSLVGKADSKEYAREQEKHHSNGHKLWGFSEEATFR